MDVQIVGNVGFDLVQELAELDRAVAGIAFADDPAGGDVEGGEQGDAMAPVVMAYAGRVRRPASVARAG